MTLAIRSEKAGLGTWLVQLSGNILFSVENFSWFPRPFRIVFSHFERGVSRRRRLRATASASAPAETSPSPIVTGPFVSRGRGGHRLARGLGREMERFAVKSATKSKIRSHGFFNKSYDAGLFCLSYLASSETKRILMGRKRLNRP